MRTKRHNIGPTKLKVGILTGGIKQDKTQLELNIGDLIKGINYQETDGISTGYTSLAGYEVFDGTALASSIAADRQEDGTYDDVAREFRRGKITTVGGTACTGSVLGCYYFEDTDTVYAVRKKVGEPDVDSIWYSSNLGWAEVTFTSNLGVDSSYKFTEGSFDLLTGLQRKKIILFASPGSKPHYIDPTLNVATEITHDDLPTDSNPISLAIFKNRFWLGYSDGRIYFSNVGDPTNFDSTTFSGNIYLEDEIVELGVTKGDVLIVYCKNSIQMIKALSSSDIADQVVVDYLFSNITLSTNSGAVDNTPQVILDDTFYIDESGLTSLTSTQSYGDFDIKSYSNSINKTLSAYYNTIVGSAINKEYNQYRLFFDNGLGIIFTFTLRNINNSTSKVIKGITLFNYSKEVTCVNNGFFGSTDGYIYKYDSGTSFNGNVITTVLATAYHHYNSPSYLKRFREIIFEGLIPYFIDFSVKASFDYRYTTYISETLVDSLDIAGGIGAIYGVDLYGSGVYGQSENQTSTYHVESYGTSMSVYISSSNKYTNSHTLSSMIVQYSINGRKM